MQSSEAVSCGGRVRSSIKTDCHGPMKCQVWFIWNTQCSMHAWLWLWLCTLKAGDFHFLWECLKVLYMILWGTPVQPGSLCNLWELLNRKQVDKAMNVFSTGDEFLLYYFKAYLKARICTLFQVSADDKIVHECSSQWLHDTAIKLLHTVMPAKSDNLVYSLHRRFLHMGFLYVEMPLDWKKGHT